MPSAFDLATAAANGKGAAVALSLLLAAAAALGACAQSPETIAPVAVDDGRYGYLTCAEMGHELARLNRGVADLSTEQRTKRVNDVVGWTHLLYPAHSARTRDIRSWIALQKGERDAVERAIVRRCLGASTLQS